MENLRTPPSSIEAEKALLGSILIDTIGVSGDRVFDLCLTNSIVEDTFFDNANRTIYAKMLEMNRKSQTLDHVTVAEELSIAGQLEAVGGRQYLTTLMEAVPTAAHAEYYIKILKSKHLRRILIERSGKVISKAYNENEYPDPQVVLGDAEKSFLEIGVSGTATMSWAEAVQLSRRGIDRMFDTGGREIEGLSTGLTHLDEKLLGLKPSEMIVIAARPSVGKTSLAMNIAESVALGRDMNNVPVKYDGGKPHPVGIFSLEMPIEALSKRMVSGRAQINTWALHRDLIPHSRKIELTDALLEAAGELAKAPIYVDDTAGLDIMDLRARARRMKKQHGIELIVIDYLQLCCCREAARNGRQIEVSTISQQIKAMAKELKIPVIVLSQLSRANEQRGDKLEKPKLSDLRDSGAIEQDADVVFLLRRPSRTSTDPDSNDLNLAIIDVAKNRNGETGEVRVNFVREFTRFCDRAIESKGVENETTSEPHIYQQNFVEDPNS